MNRKICKTANCDRPVIFRNGLPVSKWCPNCTLKKNYKKSSLQRAHKKTLKSPKIRTERQRAIDRADSWFSRFIRLKYSVEHGQILFCRCFTCGMPHNIKNIDCGHYINRGNHKVRWSTNNARPQCKRCNKWRSGEHHKFEQHLIKEIGQSAVDELKQEANKIADFSTAEIREIAKVFRLEVRRIEKEK